jgi:hypothetical protein
MPVIVYSCSNYLLSSQPIGRVAVGCCIVDDWVVHGCTDAFWVWWIPNPDAAALLHNEVNIRKIYSYYAVAPQVLHHQGSRVARQVTRSWFTSPKWLSTTPPMLPIITTPSMLPQSTTPKPPSTTLLPATIPRLQFITIPSGRILHRTVQVLLCHELRNYNWGGQVLRSPDLQDSNCSLVPTTLNRNTIPRLQFTTP